jgi:hypothetical protein
VLPARAGENFEARQAEIARFFAGPVAERERHYGRPS